MLCDIVKIRWGKEEVVFTGDRPKAINYMNKMKSCQRGKQWRYELRVSNSTVKFKQKPHNLNLSGNCQTPRLVKWGKSRSQYT